MIKEAYIRRKIEKYGGFLSNKLVKVFKLENGTLVMEEETGKHSALTVITEEEFNKLEII